MSKIERKSTDPLMVRLPNGTDITLEEFNKTKAPKGLRLGGMNRAAMRHKVKVRDTKRKRR